MLAPVIAFDRKIRVATPHLTATLTPVPMGKKIKREEAEYTFYIRSHSAGKPKFHRYTVVIHTQTEAIGVQAIAHEILLAAFPQLLQQHRGIREDWEWSSPPSAAKRPRRVFSVDIRFPPQYAGMGVLFYGIRLMRQYFPELIPTEDK